MALTGWTVEPRPADVDETPQVGEEAHAATRRLAQAKAHAAQSVSPHADIVLAADTIVVDHGQILGKPSSEDEARLMLRRLRGRPHTVVTSITVLTPDGSSLTDQCITDVPMRDYTDDEIEQFIASGAAHDKAGAYAIQDAGFQPVESASLRGCFANVMGLPLCHVVRTLRRLGIEPPEDVPQACQTHTGYECPVYEGILRGDA